VFEIIIVETNFLQNLGERTDKVERRTEERELTR